MRIIIAETIDWETSVKVGSHHYASQFLKHGHKVLWISQYLHPLSIITGEHRRTFHVLRFWRGRKSTAEPELVRYTPFTFLPCRPYKLFESEWAAKFSLKAAMPPVRSVLKRVGFDKPDVLWLSNPLLAGLADMTDYRALVLRINDKYTGFKSMPLGAQALERSAVKRADVVCATSEELVKHVEGMERNAFYLPNGVDFEHFAQTVEEPPEYKDIPTPRVLYVGAVDNWFDVDLLRDTALRLKDISFVVIGACQPAQYKALIGCDNLHLLGPRPYADLPGYCRYAHVGIIPFAVTELTKAVNPIKLYEYFAAGLPVVSTPLPEVCKHQPLVGIADRPEEFACEILKALDDNKMDERIKCAHTNSWQARFDQVWEQISSVLSS